MIFYSQLFYAIVFSHELIYVSRIIIGQVLIGHANQAGLEHSLGVGVFIQHLIYIGHEIHDPFRFAPVCDAFPAGTHQPFII